MFDFEKLVAYQKAREVSKKLRELVKNPHLSKVEMDQLNRAAI